MTADFDDLFKDIQDYLNHTDESESAEPTDKDVPQFNGQYTAELHARVVAMAADLKRLDLPHVIAINYGEEPNEKADGPHDVRRRTLIIATIRKPVCELMAMAEIAQLPHEFSHWVLDQAEKVKMFTTMRSLFSKLTDADDED